MKKVLKWTGIVIGGIVSLVILFILIAYGVTEYRQSKVYDIPKERVNIPSDIMSIERGRHIVNAIAKCGECHGKDLGGHTILDEPMMGKLCAPNLTAGEGGIAQNYNDSDWVRAIRHGVRKDGTPLYLMPAHELWYYADDDLGAIIAYLKLQPAVKRIIPESEMGPMIRVLTFLGQVELFPAELVDHTARPKNPAPGETVEYGQLLSKTGGCIGCHGPGLSGGKIPGAPPDWIPARNLTPDAVTGLGKWKEEDFFRALRTGIRPSGEALNSERMPWRATALMKDLEIKALWKYLRTLPPTPWGNR